MDGLLTLFDQFDEVFPASECRILQMLQMHWIIMMRRSSTDTSFWLSKTVNVRNMFFLMFCLALSSII